jgi:sodium transport system ATP-binding protein
VTDPRTGAAETQHLTFDHVLAALQPLTYSPDLAALLPEVIGSVAAGDYGPLFAGAMLVTADLAQQMNNALHYSVTCTEDAPRVSTADIESALAKVRSRSLATQALAVATSGPKGAGAAEAATPVQSDVPVLILSGGLDPVTPPANGAEVAKTLANSRHIVARGYGHIVSPHACAPRLIAAFIDDPTFATLPGLLRRALREEHAPAGVARQARSARLIEVENVAKAFGRRRDVRAVDGVSFTAADGEITGLLGPERRRQDDAPAHARDVDDSRQRHRACRWPDVVRERYGVRRRIGVLSDARGIYPRFSARENIRYYGALQGLSGNALETRVDELIRALSIADIADRRAHGFSQGERMKVAIARALVHDPQTILLDEPTNGLDIMSIRALRDLLRDLERRGKCLLFSSHVMQEVSALCRRIVILGHGKVVATGSSAELLARSGEHTLEDAFVRPAGVGRRPRRVTPDLARGDSAAARIAAVRPQGSDRHLPRPARDLVTLITAIVAGPVMILLVLNLVARQADRCGEMTLRWSAASTRRRSSRFLERQQVSSPRRPPISPIAFRRGDLDIVLEIDSGFAADVAKGKVATVRLVFDRSRDRARASIAEVEALLRAYNREWAAGAWCCAG